MKRGTRRLLGLDVRRLAGAAVPGARAEAELARALCRALRHRRGQLHLLPAGAPRGRRRLGGADPARVPVRGQGEPLSDPCQTTHRHPRGYRTASTSRSSRSASRAVWPGAVAATRELPSRRRAPARVAGALLPPGRHTIEFRHAELVRAGGDGRAAVARGRSDDRRPSRRGRSSPTRRRRRGRSCAFTTARAAGAATTPTRDRRVGGRIRRWRRRARMSTRTSTTTGRGSRRPMPGCCCAGWPSVAESSAPAFEWHLSAPGCVLGRGKIFGYCTLPRPCQAP